MFNISLQIKYHLPKHFSLFLILYRCLDVLKVKVVCGLMIFYLFFILMINLRGTMKRFDTNQNDNIAS